MFIRRIKSRFSVKKQHIDTAIGIMIGLIGAGVHIAGLIIHLTGIGG